MLFNKSFSIDMGCYAAKGHYTNFRGWHGCEELHVRVSFKDGSIADVEMWDGDNVKEFKGVIDGMTHDANLTRDICKQIYYSTKVDDEKQPLLETLL